MISAAHRDQDLEMLAMHGRAQRATVSNARPTAPATVHASINSGSQRRQGCAGCRSMGPVGHNQLRARFAATAAPSADEDAVAEVQHRPSLQNTSVSREAMMKM
jgi:hypothetical protein